MFHGKINRFAAIFALLVVFGVVSVAQDAGGAAQGSGAAGAPAAGAASGVPGAGAPMQSAQPGTSSAPGAVAPNGVPGQQTDSQRANDQQGLGDKAPRGLQSAKPGETTPRLGQDQSLEGPHATDQQKVSPETTKNVLQRYQQEVDAKKVAPTASNTEPATDDSGDAVVNSRSLNIPYRNNPAMRGLYQQLSTGNAAVRFGQGLFDKGPGTSDELPMDLPVGPDYVLGVGDTIAIDVWGSVSDHLDRIVDREGKISIPEVGTLVAAGQSLGSVQRSIEALLATRYRNVRASISLGKVRSIRVYVVGDVARPGAYDISSMSTVLNALFVAGGPTDRGSMRLARHYRGQQLLQEVDIYDLILRGVRSDMQRLQAGDTIMIPPIGSQVTVQGMVHRPATYELRGEKSLAELLAMAGGVLPTGTLRHVEVERVEAHDKRTMLSLDLPENSSNSAADRMIQEFQVQDRDLVRISPILAYSEKTVFVTGHVVRPGKYSYRDGMTVADLIKSNADLLPEPATHAEVIRLSPPDFRPSVMSFNVSAADGKVDAIKLTPFDTVRFFSKYDFQDAPAVTVFGEVRTPGLHQLDGESRVRDAVYSAGGLTSDAMLDYAQVYRRQADSSMKVFTIDLAKAMSGDESANVTLGVADTLVIHSNIAKIDPQKVYIHGQVARPGEYPLSAGMTARDLVLMAGGFTRGAYTESADLARYIVDGTSTIRTPHTTVAIRKAVDGDKGSDLELRDGDVLSIREITGWKDIGASVMINGEVAHGGGFGIQDGERLSSVLKRAGGFTKNAYPEGVIIEREQVKQLAQKSRDELIDRIQSQQFKPVAMQANMNAQSYQAQIDQEQLQRQQILENVKRQPVSGRIAVSIGSDVKRWENTSADIEVRAGDVITIPKRPSFVLVQGEVYGPTALTFTPGKKVSWYVQRAGGMNEQANKKNVFVVRANGTVLGRGSQGFWKGGGVMDYVPVPGDAVVVPEKIQTTNPVWQHLGESAQIMTGVAVLAKVLTGL